MRIHYIQLRLGRHTYICYSNDARNLLRGFQLLVEVNGRFLLPDITMHVCLELDVVGTAKACLHHANVSIKPHMTCENIGTMQLEGNCTQRLFNFSFNDATAALFVYPRDTWALCDEAAFSTANT